MAYRARLTNSAPFVSPALKRIAVDYDSVLVAQQLMAEVVVSNSLRKGEEAALIYRVEITAGVDDYGVDLLRVQGPLLRVTAVRVDGRELVPTESYTWGPTPDREGMLIELAPSEQINAMATVEIEGQALFVRDKTAMRFAAGNKAQGDRDGYVNWQQGREMPGATWTVLAAGTPLQLLGEVQVEPRPFSPFAAEYARFAFRRRQHRRGPGSRAENLQLDRSAGPPVGADWEAPGPISSSGTAAMVAVVLSGRGSICTKLV